MSILIDIPKGYAQVRVVPVNETSRTEGKEEQVWHNGQLRMFPLYLPLGAELGAPPWGLDGPWGSGDWAKNAKSPQDIETNQWVPPKVPKV